MNHLFAKGSFLKLFETSINFDPLQSAYHVGHSMGTAVLKMQDSFFLNQCRPGEAMCCSQSVKRWFEENNMPLNADKSDIIVTRCNSDFWDRRRWRKSEARGNNQSTWSHPGQSLDICCSCYSCVQKCNYRLWALGHTRHLLTPDVDNT